MAKIIFSNGSEIRGKIGGTVYSRNASGAYIRKFTKPTNANTLIQNSARNVFTVVASAFRDLTNVQRQTWESMRTFYTRTDSVGNVITPTASQLYARINGKLMQNGVVDASTLLSVCPTPVTVESILNLVPTWDLSANDLFADVEFGNGLAVVPADSLLVISATASISGGIKAVPASAFKRIVSLPAGTNTTTDNLYTVYTNMFSAPGSLSESIWIKTVLVSTINGAESNEMVQKIELS